MNNYSAKEWSRGVFDLKSLDDALFKLFSGVRSDKIEIYNEFSLQHELGILLRNNLTNKAIQFERNVSYFGMEKSKFEKSEIDIAIFDKHNNTLDAAIELKYPKNGQYPESMFSFCKDIVFAEQLSIAGFAKAFVIIIAEDRLFYDGNNTGIYGYFRGRKTLNGNIQKPTGNKDKILNIIGPYTVDWNEIQNPLKYTVINVMPQLTN